MVQRRLQAFKTGGPMPTQKKIDTVADLRDRLLRATIVVSADYRGLSVKDMDQMRRRLRAGGLEVKVVKNTLLRLAAQEADRSALMGIVEGPTALALAYGDFIGAAKALTEYAQGAPPTFALRGAFLDGQGVSPADLGDLVRLPPRPVMLARLLGLLDAPLQELSLLLQSALSELPALIEARARQLESSQPP